MCITQHNGTGLCLTADQAGSGGGEVACPPGCFCSSAGILCE
jgi:hypothetical protein